LKLVVTMCLLCVLCSGQATTSARSFEDSELGFKNQLAAMVADCGSDAGNCDDSIERWSKIDRSWFSKNFDASEAAELERKYDQCFDRYSGHYRDTFLGLKDSKPFEITVKKFTGTSPVMEGVTPVHPRAEIQLEKYSITIRSSKNRSEFRSTVIYHDGRFFLMGEGAHPFWEMGTIRLQGVPVPKK
jgi:hypothetical protein